MRSSAEARCPRVGGGRRPEPRDLRDDKCRSLATSSIALVGSRRRGPSHLHRERAAGARRWGQVGWRGCWEGRGFGFRCRWWEDSGDRPRQLAVQAMLLRSLNGIESSSQRDTSAPAVGAKWSAIFLRPTTGSDEQRARSSTAVAVLDPPAKASVIGSPDLDAKPAMRGSVHAKPEATFCHHDLASAGLPPRDSGRTPNLR
jgi:hypothetical protein